MRGDPARRVAEEATTQGTSLQASYIPDSAGNRRSRQTCDVTTPYGLRPSLPADLEYVVDLKSRTMRTDLERLGVWRPERSRERVEAAFAPDRTWIVEVDGERAGSVSVRDADDGHWLELFYLEPTRQGSGLGTTVLRDVLARYVDSPLPMRLDVVQGSRARALYERHGFVHDSEDAVDVFMVRRNDGGR